jgi:NADH:ubiquinone oxidoreductase subunit
MVDTAPRAGDRPVRDWQKPHIPNLTGTGLAYRPPGHTLQGGQRARSGGDYEPWQPT